MVHNTLITEEHTRERGGNAFYNAQLMQVGLDEGANDCTPISSYTCYFLKVGTTLDDLVCGGRQRDPLYRGKLFPFKPVLDSGRHLAMRMYNCQLLRSCVITGRTSGHTMNGSEIG